MRSVVFVLDISLMSHIRVTREYKLHGLSELINLDKSCLQLMGECRYTLTMSCYARRADYFYFMLILKGNATVCIS